MVFHVLIGSLTLRSLRLDNDSATATVLAQRHQLASHDDGDETS